MKQIIARIIGWFNGALVQKIIKCIPLIVAAGEKEMEDGKITAAERKSWAIKAVGVIAAEFGIQLNWIVSWAIGAIIDSVAKKLPSKDISIPDIIIKVTKEW